MTKSADDVGGQGGCDDAMHQLFDWSPGRAVVADRIVRLRARIGSGHYPIEPRLIADAILQSGDAERCGDAVPILSVSDLTPR